MAGDTGHGRLSDHPLTSLAEALLTTQLPKTFRAFFLESLEVYGDRTFVSSPLPLSAGPDAREHVTFRQVLEKSLRVAAWMRSKGLGMGSKVAIGGGNCTEWVISVAGQARAETPQLGRLMDSCPPDRRCGRRSQRMAVGDSVQREADLAYTKPGRTMPYSTASV